MPVIVCGCCSGSARRDPSAEGHLILMNGDRRPLILSLPSHSVFDVEGVFPECLLLLLGGPHLFVRFGTVTVSVSMTCE
jgi:hypothetical protein